MDNIGIRIICRQNWGCLILGGSIILILQNYLRDQPDNIKSFNIVAETTSFLNMVYANINLKTIDLVIQLFTTLNEFASGNQENRMVMLTNKVIDYINFILRAGEFDDCPQEKVKWRDWLQLFIGL